MGDTSTCMYFFDSLVTKKRKKTKKCVDNQRAKWYYR